MTTTNTNTFKRNLLPSLCHENNAKAKNDTELRHKTRAAGQLATISNKLHSRSVNKSDRQLKIVVFHHRQQNCVDKITINSCFVRLAVNIRNIVVPTITSWKVVHVSSRDLVEAEKWCSSAWQCTKRSRNSGHRPHASATRYLNFKTSI